MPTKTKPKTGRLDATCRCCHRSDNTVVYRPTNAPPSARRPICTACWGDIALDFSQCKHGQPWTCADCPQTATVMFTIEGAPVPLCHDCAYERREKMFT